MLKTIHFLFVLLAVVGLMNSAAVVKLKMKKRMTLEGDYFERNSAFGVLEKKQQDED